jgi:hypothetical protein
MKKTLTIIFLFVCTIGTFKAQKTLINRDVGRQLLRMNDTIWGPNASHFICRTFGFGLASRIQQNDSMAIKTGFSSIWVNFGLKYKRKLNETFAIGLEGLAALEQFKIAQGEKNLLSPGLNNDKQLLGFYSVGLGGYLRINFGKRGNRIGRYFDLGGDLHYLYLSRMFTKNDIDPALNKGASHEKLAQSQLDYVSKAQYFGYLKFGINKIALFARYRFSDIFIASKNINNGLILPQLPPLCIGIEIIAWEGSNQGNTDL